MMQLSRGLLAVLFAVGTSFAAAGCVSDGQGQIGATSGTGDTQDFLAKCGDDKVEPGEDCDPPNKGSCGFNCRWTCDPNPNSTVPDMCNDGNICNGEESCDGTTHTCTSGTPPADGTQSCGDISVCVGGQCTLRQAICGDGYPVPPEECDDKNTINGDGCDNCRFSCLSTDPTRDCTGDPCSKTRTCNNLTHMCSPLQLLPDYTPCSSTGATIGTAGFMECQLGICTPCGNKVVDQGEECDDGNTVDGDGCDQNCKHSCDPTDHTRDCTPSNPCLAKLTCDTTTWTCPAESNRQNGTYCSTTTVAQGNCISGACVPPVCGDGIVAQNGLEVCDDGNLNPKDGCKPDCSYTCTTSTAVSDCTSTTPPLLLVPTCNKVICTNNMCSYTADTSQTNCNTSGGSGTCTSGNPSACTTGVCGNGILDQGEECDLGSGNGPGTGCELTCQYSCHSNADCDDQDPCNGTETCQISGTLGTPQACIIPNQIQPDGTACGTGRICLNGGCAVSICGDGFVNTAAGEQCDPPNTSGCDANCKAIKTCTGYDDAWWSDQNLIPVTWGGNLIAQGTGTIAQITLAHAVSVAGSSPPQFTLDLRPCALTIPDFGITTDTVNYQVGPYAGEKYGIEFLNVFENATRTFQSGLTLASLSPGAKVGIQRVSLLMGLTMDNPLGSWPPSWTDLTDGILSPYEQEDYDHDTLYGLTVTSKAVTDTTGTYKNPIVNLDNFTIDGTVGRADKLYLSTRAAVTQQGTLVDCETITGYADILYIDTHIVGCHRAEAGVGECSSSDVNLVDSVSPKYTVTGTSTFTAKHLATAPDPASPCAVAIAAYP